MKFSQDIIRQTLTFTAVFAAFGVNVLANVKPIGGLTLGEISNQLFEQVLITPANYAFAIWGLIYIGLFSFAIYQVLPSQREKYLFRYTISYWLIIASLGQIVWVFLFQLRFFIWSFVAMLIILFPLIRVYSQLDRSQIRLSRREEWFVHIPLAIYCAWISVATIVNGAVSLTDIGWQRWGISPEVWTVIMMGVGGAIALVVALLKQDIAFTAVFVWAFVAIAIRHWEIPLISMTGIILSVILVAVTLLKYQQSRNFQRL